MGEGGGAVTKAKTQGQRRRSKVGRPAKAGKREPSGRAQRPTAAQQADSAQETALTARLRRFGHPDTPEGRKAAQSALFEAPVGCCIAAMVPSLRAQLDLWAVFCDLAQAKRNWQQRVTSTNPNPQAAAIAMLPDAMQADEGHSIDLRTPQERDEAASRVWHYWLAMLMDLPPAERHALRGEIDGYGLRLWDEENRRPTMTGAMAVKGLQALHRARA
jgi:hypothetical protein